MGDQLEARSLTAQQHALPETAVCGVREAKSGRRFQARCVRHINVAPAYEMCLPALPRKEVIQPQLPLRLPCYDFTPVTSPTFDGSLPKGLGHRLRVLLTPVV